MSTVRIFETAEQAEAAADKLRNGGFRRDTIAVVNPAMGGEAAAVDAAVRDGVMPEVYRRACIQALQRGRSLVAIDAPFGHEQDAVAIMTRAGAVDSEMLPEYSRRDPAPFSDILGMPVLSRSRTTTQLSERQYTFPSWLGLPLLTKTGGAMFGGLSKPKRNWTSSLGLPLLTKGGRPMFGGLTKSKRNWTTSFGFPLLSRNSAPLSSMFGIPPLTRRRGSDD